MSFITEAVSGIGGRELNEDSYGFLEINQTACWVVADGLGGHRGGATASRVAVDAALASFHALPELSAASLKRHLEAAQEAVLDAQKDEPSLSTMRTTIVILLSDSRSAIWAHAGDSRLYCLENGHIEFWTKDHSVVQAMVSAGELPPSRIRHHEDRNRLLRCLGSSDGEFRPTIQSDPRNLHSGTSFLLCTDGFWEDVLEEEIEADFAKAEGTRDWLASMDARRRRRSDENSDNYTVIAVMFDAETAASSDSDTFIGSRKMNNSTRGHLVGIGLAGVLLIALVLPILRVWERLRGLEREVVNLTAQKDALQKQSETQRESLSHLQQQFNEAQKNCKAASPKIPEHKNPAAKTGSRPQTQQEDEKAK